MDRIKVLLVDDEGELISTMVERLEYRDVDADYATSGFEALKMVETTNYDLIIIDLKMPGMSGTDLIKVITNKFPDLPVFLMTGHGDITENQELPPGIVEYIAKPIKIDELVRKMREVLNRDE